MALMTYREANQVLWRGVRPGHDGTQRILKIDTVLSVEIAEVTAGLTYYLTGFSLGIIRNADAFSRLVVRNVVDAEQYDLAYVNSFTACDGEVFGLTFPFPLEISAGWDFYVYATAAVHGFIAGWEE